MSKRYKEYTNTEKEFYFYIGLLSAKYAKMEVLVRNTLGAFISDDDVLNAYLFDRNSISANIELIKTVNIRHNYESETLKGILSEVKSIKNERDLFIHGIWSAPQNKNNDIIINCSNPKMNYTKEPNSKVWKFGSTKVIRLTFIKKIVSRLDDVIIFQESFLKRLKNFDLEFGYQKDE